MESLVLAALLFLTAQAGAKSDVVTRRFGLAAGDAAARLLDVARSRMRGNDAARPVLERFEAEPGDPVHFTALRRQLNVLRVRDEGFHQRLSELTGEVRAASEALWEGLERAGREIQQGIDPGDIAFLAGDRVTAEIEGLRVRLRAVTAVWDGAGGPDSPQAVELRLLIGRLDEAVDAYLGN
ncbi:hypothetical protein [Actinoplanes sp. NPDC051494]|uniref:hypothetical protein n=1 Tax=Actinoplanes sp. NPDC051494 TaxID=3363907 RepID=UPI0037961792